MNIAILDDYQDVVKTLDCFSLLKKHQVKILTKTYSEVELIDKLKDVQALVLIRERTTITKNLLLNLPNLKVISQTGKVSNHLNLKLCEEYKISVLEGVGSSIAPAELCWALIMNSSRNILQYSNNLANNIWQSSNSFGLGKVLNNQRIGIWGYGKIGQQIAKYAKAFNMQVVVYGSKTSQLKAKEDGFESVGCKKEFFSSCDIITLHLKLTQETFECVKKEDLELMKADSLFVNISRAALVEKNALFNELNNNKTKRAIVDVFDIEPATIENEPLLSLENVLCTPHLGYVEKSNYELYFKAAFENLLEYIKS
ncbi:3-phosphoglycerate dehydrogenase [Malaciobacter mytili]|uniref:D-2-hydroxyacid dehydrogenase family protein n=1 Tax=Malaciobacter mytili TaxID=603050 RepID=UPI00100B6637|nr:D-2-hydroxyacid dehydrogenase family protein [Malaciobacter mytili]RXI45802.1 3-phosphoglycerate dehydrogenase [Malaciobacter mytili]